MNDDCKYVVLVQDEKRISNYRFNGFEEYFQFMKENDIEVDDDNIKVRNYVKHGNTYLCFKFFEENPFNYLNQYIDDEDVDVWRLVDFRVSEDN
jgi:hypothetical protein